MKGDLTDFHTLLCILTFVYNFKKDYAASRNFALRAVATVAINITSGNTGRQGTFMAPIDPWMATTQAEPINPATNNRQDELIGTHWVWPCSFQSSHNQAPRSHPEAISPPKSHEALREGVNGKKTFSFGHCPNYLNPPPWPEFGQLGPLFSDVKIQDLKISLELKILYILYNILYICNLKNS